LNPGPADNRFRLSAHCANEPQRQAKCEEIIKIGTDSTEHNQDNLPIQVCSNRIYSEQNVPGLSEYLWQAALVHVQTSYRTFKLIESIHLFIITPMAAHIKYT